MGKTVAAIEIIIYTIFALVGVITIPVGLIGAAYTMFFVGWGPTLKLLLLAFVIGPAVTFLGVGGLIGGEKKFKKYFPGLYY